MTNEKEDLETLIYIYADENHQKAWDLNGFEIILDQKTKAEIKKFKEENEPIECFNKDYKFIVKNESYVLKSITGEPASARGFSALNYNITLTSRKDKKEFGLLGNNQWAPLETKHPEIFLAKIPKTLGIIPLGIGSGFSTEHVNTCFILDADKLYLIDCPEDLRKIKKLEEKISDVILTHNDPDHVGALRKFVQKKRFLYKEKLNIYTTYSIYTDFKDSLYNLQKDLEKSINFIDLKTEKAHKTNGGLKIRIRNNLHGGIPTIGLKFYFNGKSLGYSSDCNSNRDFLDIWYEDAKRTIRTALNPINTTESLTGGSRGVVDNVNDLLMLINSELLTKVDAEQFFGLDAETIIKSYKINLFRRYKDFHPSWFRNCDMIIHEATDNPDDPVHTYIGELEKLPASITNKLYVTHIPDGFKKKFNKIPILRPNLKYLVY